MQMKKMALSLLVIAASGAYVWDQSRQQPEGDPLGATRLEGQAQATAPSPRVAVASAAPGPVVEMPAASLAAADCAPQPVPEARPAFRAEPVAVAQAAMTIAQNAGFADGTYTGPAVDAYYGVVQIQAIVQGGQLIGLNALQYPSDRRTSIAINRQALPMLRDEAVAAQRANVDIITGATLTSEAFIRSLDGALGKARS
jgi:uncharacterized protein with FMN-binding domain